MPDPILQTQSGAAARAWEQWQIEIVRLLKTDFELEAFWQIGLDDVDWPSWRNLFLQGRSPRSAINRALELDL